MRVLQINAVYGYGSTGVIVQDIHNVLQENGIESYVAFSMCSPNVDPPKGSYQIGSAADRKMHALLGRISGKQAYYSYFSTKKLLSCLDSIKPDVVHLHNIHNNYINLPLLCSYLKEHNIGTVITLHDCWYYTGGCYHYSAVNCSKWMTHCNHCVKRYDDTPALLYDASNQIFLDRSKLFGGINNLVLVGVSYWISNEAKKSLFKDRIIRTIHNGVDTDFFRPVKPKIKEQFNIQDKFVILGFANKWLSPENKELLSKVLRLVDDKTALIIAGCTKRQMKQLPKEIIPVCFIQDRVALRELYASCDLFVNCTHEESLSMVNLEAQACGTPVITYDATGVSETVDGISGFSIKVNDSDGIIESILKIRDIGKSNFSEKCRFYICEHFEKSKNYLEYLSLYQKMRQ